MKYILSISGGGVRGAIAAKFLDLVSQEFCNGTLLKTFNLSIGTSQGVFLLFNASLNPKNQLIDLFNTHNMNQIMKKSVWDRVMQSAQFEPVYDGRGKRKILESYLGSRKISVLEDKIIIPLLDLSIRKPCIIKSWETPHPFTLCEIADAASAAIPYFPAVEMSNHSVYADGGYVANNPILIAYTEARELFPHEPLRILSVGTGKQKQVEGFDPQWGAIQWICNGLTEMAMESSNSIMVQEASKLLNMESRKNRLLHVDIPIDNTKFDDIESLSLLEKKGEEMFQLYHDDLKQFFLATSSRTWSCGKQYCVV